MNCPRCSYEWDVRQSPCPRCGLHVRPPGPLASANSQGPRKTLPLNKSHSLFPAGDSAVRVESSYRREPISDALGQTPFPSSLRKKLQLSKFPDPPTGESSLQRQSSPSLDGSYVLTVQQAPPVSGVSFPGVQADMSSLLPSGTLIHRDRYSLQKELQKQEWPLDIVETVWAAYDTRVAMSPVIIYELSIPSTAPKEVQDIPYLATKVFTSIGRNAHILSLLDVFSENEHSFFVFESVSGSSLLTLMFNSRRNLPEKDVVACCLQIVDLLHVCTQQFPPLIHGNIRPEYVVRRSLDSQYVLTNFSVALAGGLAHIVTDMEDGSKTPPATDTLMRGKIDVRTDLYALLAMAHYAVRGYWLSGLESSGIPTQMAGSDLSPHLRAILLKGLLAPFHQRYQSPAELYQDLLVLHRRYEKASSPLGSTPTEQPIPSFSPVMQTPKSRSTDLNIADQLEVNPAEDVLLAILPKTQAPLQDAPDVRNAVLWFTAMLLCLLLLLGPHLL